MGSDIRRAALAAIAGLGAVAGLAAASPADAAIVVTVSGILEPDAFDGLGLAGPAGGSLVGDPFSLQVMFRTPNYNSPTVEDGFIAQGGANLRIYALSATLNGVATSCMTISVNNCQPFNLSGAIVMMGEEFGGASAGTLKLNATSVTSAGSYDIDLNLNLMTNAANFFDLDDYNGLTIPVGGGNFFGGEIEIINAANDQETLATLGGEQVTFESVPNPIPEPAAWTLMIAGFGLTGAALRRRRSIRLAPGFA